MVAKPLAKSCVQAALEFLDRRPWLRVANDELFVFDLPQVEVPVAGSVMGHAGEEFGLLLMTGEDAVANMLEVVLGLHEGDEGLATSRLLSMSLDSADALDPPFLRILEDAGYRNRRVPLFFAKDPGHRPRPPRTRELEILEVAMRALLLADSRGMLPRGDARDPRLLPTLRVSGRGLGLRVSVDFAPLVLGEIRAPDPIAPPVHVAELPRLDACYDLGFAASAFSVQDDAREIRVLAVFDARTGMLIGHEAIAGVDLEHAAQLVFEVLGGDRQAPAGLPHAMRFRDLSLYTVLAPGLEELGVACSHDPALASIQEFSAVIDAMPGQSGSGAEVVAEGGDDLAMWKAADQRLSHRIAGLAQERAPTVRKAKQRYFGDPDAPLAEPSSLAQFRIMSYCEWFAYRYRSKPNVRTIAERVLARRDLGTRERVLLESRIAATPSFYRVESHSSGHSIDVLDIVSGERLTVHDRALSLSVPEGVCLVMRVYAAGEWRFASPAGPLLPPHQVEAALDFLEMEAGVEIDREGLAASEHLLGRLWYWLDTRAAQGITFTNTEGHAFVPLTASFAVGDPEALAAALEARDDFDAVDGGWTWFSDEADAAGAHTQRGHLELLGDELTLDVNSRERLAAAQELLEAVPGVALRAIREHDFDPSAPNSRPLDDRLPAPMEPLPDEAVEQIAASLRRRYMAWLDESIPALGNRTPRQAAAEPDLRDKVARMIRSYPDPQGLPGVEVPRAAMLRELGLE